MERRYTMKIYNLPIEPLEQRYSKQWLTWFEEEFTDAGIVYETILGDAVPDEIITGGSFLDVVNTNKYKLSQLQKLLTKELKDGDIIFLHDMWFPGIEALAYIRDGLGINFKIVGCLHDGSYNKHDFLYKKGMQRWASFLEEAWFNLFDEVYVATTFHKKYVQQRRLILPGKIIVTGFPIYAHEIMSGRDVGNVPQRNIIFPHRLTEEKQPELFSKLSESFPDYVCIKTQQMKLSKEKYYDLLHQSVIAVSFAHQEMWGIAMQEALFLNCVT